MAAYVASPFNNKATITLVTVTAIPNEDQVQIERIDSGRKSRVLSQNVIILDKKGT